MIEDAKGPTSIAGIMGGARSEVAPDTTRVLMEVANWNGPSIHRTSWALGLRSEASSRFEKGLQPEQACTRRQSPRALMVELCGATLLPGHDRRRRQPVRTPQPIGCASGASSGILGVPVAVARQQEILTALDFDVERAGEGLSVTVPPCAAMTSPARST